MKIRIAINGYGRVGRCILRALYEYQRNHEIEIVAINDLGDNQGKKHLTQYDTAHGRFNASVELDENHLIINGDKIQLLAERDPEKLPWSELKVDVVWNAQGCFALEQQQPSTSLLVPKKSSFQHQLTVKSMPP